MSLSADLLFAFLCVFTRCTAMLLSSPLFGNTVPVNIRIQTGMVISFALTPVLQPKIGHVPDQMITLVILVAREALTGILIGSCLQLLASAAEIAGSFADLQLGLSSAAVFSPMMGTTATPLSRFKYMLAIVTLLSLNAHHMMIQGFVHSYSMPGISLDTLRPVYENLLGLIGQMLLLAMQIAAPVAGVCILIDMAAGFINKAVPQTQPFLLALPAKLVVGLTALSIGLPALTAGVRFGVEFTFSHMSKALGGG